MITKLLKKIYRQKIVIFSTTITFGTILMFTLLSIENDFLNMPLNEIGDSVAGFSGFLAFLWIIVAIHIQSAELSLQRIQMRDIGAANSKQAELMAESTKIQALTHLKTLREEWNGPVGNIAEKAAHSITLFMKNFEKHPYYGEFIGHSKDAINHIYSYFLKSVPDDLYSIGPEHIRDDFDYEAYLLFTDIFYGMEEAWEIVAPLRELSINTEGESEQKAWERNLDIYWFQDEYKIAYAFKESLDKKISLGGFTNDFVTSFLKVRVQSPKKRWGYYDAKI